MATNPNIEKAITELTDQLLQHEKNLNLIDFFNQHVESILIKHVLNKTDGNQTKASEILGISRSTLRYKLKNININ